MHVRPRDRRSHPRLAALAMAVAGAVAGVVGAAQAPSPAVARIQDRWAVVLYQSPKAQRGTALEALSGEAADARAATPGDAAALIWEGIVLSSLAGERGGLGALRLVKRARADFEQAMEIEPAALDGAAYTSLGALYYQVPGWPLGFGDDDKARELLAKGLAIDPDGIDSNYFHGDFLRDQKDWRGAEAAFEKALAAPARPNRQVADEGRRREIEAKLAEVRTHLGKS